MRAEWVLERAIVALTVGVLVVGAVGVGSLGDGRVARAVALVTQLYEDDDVDAVLDLAVEGSIEPDSDLDALRRTLTALFTQPSEVTSVASVDVRGTGLVQVIVGTTEWCVSEDARLLLGCRIGEVEVSSAPVDGPVEVAFAGVDVFATAAEMAIVLASDEPTDLDGVALEGPAGAEEFDLRETAYVVDGVRFPSAGPIDEVHPGAAVLVLFERVVERDPATVAEGPYRLSWDGGSVTLSVDDVRWFVG